jgi:hypothetical protein
MLLLMAGLMLALIGSNLYGGELSVLGILIAVIGGYYYFYRGMLWVDLDDIDY